MHGRPVTQSTGEASPSHPDRWRILGVLVLALLVTSVDHTIINVALPRFVEGLKANSADLQWVVASYTIVFAGLLLTAGSLGDRFGRRHALAAGLATFLAGSLVSATATSTTALIVGRGVMGVGGALIIPMTLSILVNVFGDPRERAKAIAVWTAASGQRPGHRARPDRRRNAHAQLLLVVSVLDQRAAPRRCAAWHTSPHPRLTEP